MTRRKKGWMPLKIVNIREENHNTRTIYLHDAEDGGRQFDYIAGQYLTLRFDDLSDKPVARSYTMSSSPRQSEHIAITIKEVPDPFVSRYLVRDLKVGDIVRARGPMGKFCYDPSTDQEHLVMVGAGSGVTPFISIMGEFGIKLGQPGCPKQLSLLVSYQSQKDLILWEEICALKALPNCRIVTSLSRESVIDPNFWQGRINESAIDRFVDGNYSGKTFMTCGPQALMDLTENALKAKGVPDSCIKTESFQ
jgi:ring-1,2-phenylacetyl-CoA epoxidase subunit PaaE